MKRLINAGALADKLRTRKVMSGEKAVQDAYETAMWDALNEPEVTLNALRDEVYEDAVAHGLWEKEENKEDAEYAQRGPMCGENLIRACGASKIWDEALELDRAWKNPEHYAEELADVIIMSLSVAGKLGIDIDAAVKRKMEINKGRPWKHGKE
jgi:NTP pyrophosphatase (non-canonical NTP hydrolase)